MPSDDSTTCICAPLSVKLYYCAEKRAGTSDQGMKMFQRFYTRFGGIMILNNVIKSPTVVPSYQHIFLTLDKKTIGRTISNSMRSLEAQSITVEN